MPAYNEAGTVAASSGAIHDKAPDFDVLVVDDGSTDATADAGRGRRAPKVLRHPFNLGIGGAVQSGFTYALENGYDRLVQVDGDGQHDPAEIAKLEAAMDDGRGARHGLRLALPRPRQRLRARRSAAAPASTSSRSCCRGSSASA